MENRKKYIWLAILMPLLVVVFTNIWMPIPEKFLPKGVQLGIALVCLFIGGYALYMANRDTLK